MQDHSCTRCVKVPYRMAQATRVWELRHPPPGGSGGPWLEAHMDLVVKSRSHKRMAIGPGGELLRRIQAAAQADAERHLGVPVRLRLWVKESTAQGGAA